MSVFDDPFKAADEIMKYKMVMEDDNDDFDDNLEFEEEEFTSEDEDNDDFDEDDEFD